MSARNVRLDHLLGVYRVGSGDWAWREEYDNLINQTDTQKLLARIREEGIREPILLGTGGRIWDGHHRIIIAMHLGLDSVPVEFAGEGGALNALIAEKRAEWEAEQGEVEWAYGVTTKWGIHEHPHLEGAERYAADVRDEIENGRASGDLEYHGRVMKRTKAKAGEWVPVNENAETP